MNIIKTRYIRTKEKKRRGQLCQNLSIAKIKLKSTQRRIGTRKNHQYKIRQIKNIKIKTGIEK